MPRRPPVIGLTGGIGAGKSEVLRAFDRLGLPTISADAIVHELLGGEQMAGLLSERWGPEVLSDGAVDRGRVAAIVFDDPDELRWLESELHPRVGERIAEWRERLDPDAPLAVIEVPLLFETGMEPAFDRVVAVTAPDGLRAERLAERGQNGSIGREGRQLDQAAKAERADHVIVNDGTLDELTAAVSKVVAEVSQ